jgi:HlyD family secretion protein
MDPLSAELASLRIDRTVSTPETVAPRESRALSRALWGTGLVLAVAGAAAGAVTVAPRVRAQLLRPTVTATPVISISPSAQDASFTASGYVVAEHTSRVGTQVMGRLARVLVKEGDVVKAGDVLADLDDHDTRASIVAAEARATAAAARVDTARANLAEVEQQVQREDHLAASGAVPKASLEDLQRRQDSLARAVRAADAEARANRAELAPLAATLGDHVVRAPIDGVVWSKPMDPGDVATPGGRPVVELFDRASLVVETDVPEARLELAKPGAPCEIVLDAFPSKRFRGQAFEIGTRVDRAKATVTVKVRFLDTVPGVLPDMSARTNFLSKALSADEEKAPAKRAVASSAIVTRGGRKVVMTLDGDVVRAVPVTPGASLGATTELVDGPAQGTRVVADPPPSLEDGQTINEKRD